MTLGLDQGPSVVLVAAVEDRRGFVIDTSQLKCLMYLLLEVLVSLDVLQPVVVHLDGLIGARVRHLKVRVHARQTKLLLFELSGQLH